MYSESAPFAFQMWIQMSNKKTDSRHSTVTIFVKHLGANETPKSTFSLPVKYWSKWSTKFNRFVKNSGAYETPKINIFVKNLWANKHAIFWDQPARIVFFAPASKEEGFGNPVKVQSACKVFLLIGFCAGQQARRWGKPYSISLRGSISYNSATISKCVQNARISKCLLEVYPVSGGQSPGKEN